MFEMSNYAKNLFKIKIDLRKDFSQLNEQKKKKVCIKRHEYKKKKNWIKCSLIFI